MCSSSKWEESELLKDEERREEDEGRSVEAAAERSATERDRERESERELVQA